MIRNFSNYLYKIIWGLLLINHSTGNAQCPCKPDTKISHQERSLAKHEKHFENFKHRKNTVTIRTMALWDNKYKAKTASLSDQPSTKRVARSPEDTLYVLRGYMWFVKREANDCDLHIEIGKESLMSTRIIVEVTKENCELQQKILDKLILMNLKLNKHFSKGIPCFIKGLGFYDSSHRSDGNHGDVHTNDHIWELHPVIDVIWN